MLEWDLLKLRAGWPSVRRRAAQQLGGTRGTRYDDYFIRRRASLRALIGDSNPEVRVAGARQLRALVDYYSFYSNWESNWENRPTVRAALLRALLTDESPEVRVAAARVYEQIIDRADYGELAADFRSLRSDDVCSLLRDPHPSVLRMVTEWLGYAGQIEPRLIDALAGCLKAQSSSVRTQAIMALMKVPEPDSQLIDALILCLGHEDSSTRTAAIEALARLSTYRGTRSMVLDRVRIPGERAIDMPIDCADYRLPVVDRLVVSLTHSQSATREGATKVLRLLDKVPGVDEALRQAANNDDAPSVRLAAAVRAKWGSASCDVCGKQFSHGTDGHISFLGQDVIRSGHLPDALTGIAGQMLARKFECPSCRSLFCLECGNKKGRSVGTGSTRCPECATEVL
ncbi:MAG: HEAT repeat domain-containing protein [Acidobacteria bacterium]|nr:HEAT repeat domain-containing protein [Acidobacteriota bacterium]